MSGDETALRREAMGSRLLRTLEDVAERSGLSEDEALDLAYAERDAMRAERRASGRGSSDGGELAENDLRPPSPWIVG